MRVDIVMISDVEAEVHYRPGRWGAFWGERHTYTPIVRLPAREERNAGGGVVQVLPPLWVHRHTGRPVDEAILDHLEHLPHIADRTSRQLLLEAAEEVDATE